MGNNTKIIDFSKFCSRCEYYDKTFSEEPCNTCLSHPARENSHTPEKFVEKGRYIGSK